MTQTVCVHSHHWSGYDLIVWSGWYWVKISLLCKVNFSGSMSLNEAISGKMTFFLAIATNPGSHEKGQFFMCSSADVVYGFCPIKKLWQFSDWFLFLIYFFFFFVTSIKQLLPYSEAFWVASDFTSLPEDISSYHYEKCGLSVFLSKMLPAIPELKIGQSCAGKSGGRWCWLSQPRLSKMGFWKLLQDPFTPSLVLWSCNKHCSALSALPCEQRCRI